MHCYHIKLQYCPKWKLALFLTGYFYLGSFVGVFLPNMISSWDMGWTPYFGLGDLFPPSASVRFLLSFGESLGDVKAGIPGEVLPFPPVLRAGMVSFWDCPCCFINLFPLWPGLIVSPKLILLVSWKVGVLLLAEPGLLVCFRLDKFLLCCARISVKYKRPKNYFWILALIVIAPPLLRNIYITKKRLNFLILEWKHTLQNTHTSVIFNLLIIKIRPSIRSPVFDMPCKISKTGERMEGLILIRLPLYSIMNW
jgi:hypothetical protein